MQCLKTPEQLGRLLRDAPDFHARRVPTVGLWVANYGTATIATPVTTRQAAHLYRHPHLPRYQGTSVPQIRGTFVDADPNATVNDFIGDIDWGGRPSTRAGAIEVDSSGQFAHPG